MKKKLKITSNFQKNISISEQELKLIKGGAMLTNQPNCCEGDTFPITSLVNLPKCANSNPDPIGG